MLNISFMYLFILSILLEISHGFYTNYKCWSILWSLHSLCFYLKQSVTLLSENLITNATLVLPSESIILLLSQIYFFVGCCVETTLSLLFISIILPIFLSNQCCFIMFGNISTVASYYY